MVTRLAVGRRLPGHADEERLPSPAGNTDLVEGADETDGLALIVIVLGRALARGPVTGDDRQPLPGAEELDSLEQAVGIAQGDCAPGLAAGQIDDVQPGERRGVGEQHRQRPGLRFQGEGIVDEALLRLDDVPGRGGSSGRLRLLLRRLGLGLALGLGNPRRGKPARDRGRQTADE